MTHPALTHLEDAEASLMSFIARITDESPEADEEPVDLLPVVMAVLRSVSRAAGGLESLDPQE